MLSLGSNLKLQNIYEHINHTARTINYRGKPIYIAYSPSHAYITSEFHAREKSATIQNYVIAKILTCQRTALRLSRVQTQT